MQVSLAVNGATVATQTVELQPGQAREVQFRPYLFDVSVQPGRTVFVPAEVSLPADNLPADDRRFLAVPVVASLPVVFVDQYGPDENARYGRVGETYRLRRLLAPVTARGQTGPQLVQVRHAKIDRVDREMLKDARLVVIAGVPKPPERSARYGSTSSRVATWSSLRAASSTPPPGPAPRGTRDRASCRLA